MSRVMVMLLVTCLPWGAMAATPEDALAYVDAHPLAKPLADTLAQNRVVFVGEVHDRYDHHLNQLAVLRALHQKNPNIAIGVEWFQQPFQAVVNDFLAGKINETELLRGTEYFERWGYDYRQLRPIMEYAKANHLPVIALNAPVELTRKVSKGGLEALSSTERAQLPATINPPDTAYRARLQKIFAVHSKDKTQFEHFLTVQRIWDETMAYNVVNYLQKHPQHQVVVFAGVGHISDGAGIPADVIRQIPAIKLATVASASSPDAPPNSVDHTLPSPLLELPPLGRLGLLLNNQEDSLVVTALDPNSGAVKAGVREADRVVSLEGVTIRNMTELKLVLAQRTAGETVTLVVERSGEKDLLSYAVVLH
ncbi:ChaN family lipoprotein [Thiothrix lacustris]|uniref:ChaN family lipoprotein n=1 Tax=Thiothrix lacustris TaxID=525917 RepID=A0ABY9MKV4_9GAMM|nr:ChaN family lipoprotein [Thiothrix lacustris]WML89231.1 ChaN family lipoprotein [Thiothrix lacustris]